MKQITAVIRPHRVEHAVRALHRLPHFPGYTLLRGCGEGRGRAEGGRFEPSELDIDEPPYAVLMVVCADEHAVTVADTLRGAARTGLPGDGIVSTVEASDVARIRTGERGDAAV